MDRRQFLSSTGTAALVLGAAAPLSTRKQQLLAALVPAPLPSTPPPTFQGVASDLRITDIRIVRPRQRDRETFQAWLSQSLVANPMSIYPKYKAERASWQGLGMGDVWVEVSTNKGLTGWGRGGGGGASEFIILNHFKKLLVGEDPFDVERLWDIMFRSSLPYGRKGVAIMAMSGVDLALWDLIGKASGLPVYKLLGGKTKDRIPAYATGNDVEWYQKLGYKAFKLAMPYGPADGNEGMRQNQDLVKKTRETVGPETRIMLDCYMAWDVEYTIRMAERIEPYKVFWIEECLPPDEYEGYGRINREINSTLVATGEHEFTRWGFQELLYHNGADVLQADINWCGGMTEIRRIAAMAAGRNLPVIPHAGGNVFALHFIMATPNAPMAETIGPSRQIDAERKSFLRVLTPLAEDGFVAPSDKPGFGLDLTPYLT
jgi:L-rhamnonate dehydratase